MVDLAPDNWAYPAIEVLMDRYHIMGGFPDHTFRGNDLVDRYQLAAILARVMDRMQALGPAHVNAADQTLVDRLAEEFNAELTELQKDHDDINLIKQKLGLAGPPSGAASASAGVSLPVNLPKPATSYPNSRLSGDVGTTIEQDPQSGLFPFWVSSTRLAVRGRISDNVSASFAFHGAYAPTDPNLSPPPPIAGGGKNPTGSIGLSGSAGVTANYKGGLSTKVELGSFYLGGLMNLKGFAGHWGDGIIGSGLNGPGANPVRGDRDEALAGEIETRGIAAAAAITPQFVEGYAGYDSGWGDVNILGDVDHDSFGNVQVSGARAYDLAASLDLGSDLEALMFQFGLTGSGRFLQDAYQPLASAQAVLNLQVLNKTLPAIEIAAGAGYSQSPSNQASDEEVQPSAYVFIPALAPHFPTFLAALTEPITLASKAGKTGEGSLLGHHAGWTIQSVIDNPILPNLTLEADLQQDVLFGATYDGWAYAISSSLDF